MAIFTEVVIAGKIIILEMCGHTATKYIFQMTYNDTNFEVLKKGLWPPHIIVCESIHGYCLGSKKRD
jgi:hypothetical protein